MSNFKGFQGVNEFPQKHGFYIKFIIIDNIDKLRLKDPITLLNV
jgi:hypothetical protein